ncbi:protein phosphatase [Streptomyces lunaelactis]|uniref:protein-tyrosine phosphatase family protein n=1 Tax=Streptomyces lunaelactis TaxID=1535768 RepID=UPI001585741F|nr:protein phosphatase [Streptomyces lunaelactis]NUK05900.1 protein phosphatase [Streptomyces lunaelactis]NUK12509.1 protein phosphatase [Streptomyces lunaelactis]NUK20391.1 protein phosphatase [Streptomyces lunaelactis]NUK27877.1 protein phosphatase [Streptomyces lunaelactis]NUK38874.1 protein phosphatase [Streptomyces lunaelactis]
MKARRTDHHIPDPRSPWDEITTGLWMGGHVWEDDRNRHRNAVVDREFDLVISLFTRDGHGPPEGVEHHVAPIPDDWLTSPQIDRVRLLAVIAAEAIRAGRTALVRCYSGYNRSGLVVAQTLIELGHDGPGAIDLVRRRRSSYALHNAAFEQYLLTGLDIASLLTGLEAPS